MTGFTKEQVQEAVDEAKLLLCNNLEFKKAAALEGLLQDFLAALPVIEWYGDRENYANGDCCDMQNLSHDHGTKAREYLEKLNQNK